MEKDHLTRGDIIRSKIGITIDAVPVIGVQRYADLCKICSRGLAVGGHDAVSISSIGLEGGIRRRRQVPYRQGAERLPDGARHREGGGVPHPERRLERPR
jgi:hypothetical protein